MDLGKMRLFGDEIEELAGQRRRTLKGVFRGLGHTLVGMLLLLVFLESDERVPCALKTFVFD